jgi:hypothetical protein
MLPVGDDHLQYANPLAHLMKSVNPKNYSINDFQGKENKVLDYLT